MLQLKFLYTPYRARRLVVIVGSKKGPKMAMARASEGALQILRNASWKACAAM
jgi:hypothetical protein